MTTTLITGSNKGLGYEAARQLIGAGHTVYVAARDAERGAKAAAELGGRFVQLDVTDDASVAAAVATVEADAGQLDVLVNNAGIVGGNAGGPAAATADTTLATFETNVFGVVRVTHAFLPLLQRSSTPVVVNVSSGLGSLTWTADTDRLEGSFAALEYPASKAALNMITRQYAKAFPAIRVNAVDPGYTATDLNGNSGHQTIEEGAEILVAMAQIGTDGPTGGYFNRDGVVPW